MQFSVALNVSDETSLYDKTPAGLAPGLWLIALVFDGWGANGDTSTKTFNVGIEGAQQVATSSTLTGELAVGSDVYSKPVFATPSLYHVTANNPQITLTLESTEPSTTGRLSGTVWVFAERVGG